MSRYTPITFIIISFLYISCTKNGSLTRPTTDMSGGLYSSGPGGIGTGGGTGNTPGVITAGEWNDLKNWDFWKTLLTNDTFHQYENLWGIHTLNRVSIQINDAGGRKVPDVKLSLQGGSFTYSGVTDNFGNAELFPGIYTSGTNENSFQLKAEYRGQSFDLGTISAVQGSIVKSIPVTQSSPNTLDIQFVVDATGSMGDELKYLKTELKDVVQRAGNQLPGVSIRMGSVFYRDHGDEYLLRPFSFTTSIIQLNDFINNQNADGGGDFPEAVDEALNEAINHQQWSSHAINRIIFVVLDAPCHQTEDVLGRMHNDIRSAMEKGIRIIPISASGIDKAAEFLFRFWSIATNGTYVFITNDSGVGDTHLTPTVGHYDVEYLNNLMVRLIAKYGKVQP